MAGQTYPFVVNAAETKTIGPLGFIPTSIGVDNPNLFYVNFLGAGTGAWVNTNVRGAVVPAPFTARFFQVSSQNFPPEAPAGTTLAVTGQAVCIAYEDPQPPSPGYPTLGSSQGTAFASLSRGIGTYTFTAPPATTKGIIVFIKTTSFSGGTLTVSIFNVSSSGITASFLTSAALTTNTTTVMRIYPGLLAVANSIANDVLTGQPQVQAVVTGGSVTFSIDYTLVP